MRTSSAHPLLPASLAAIVFLSTLATGCVYGDLKQVLRSQVASETGCASVKVSQRQEYTGAEAGQYTVEACGEKRRYTCPTEGGLYDYDEPICNLEGSRKAGPPPMPTAGGEDEDDEALEAPPADDAEDDDAEDDDVQDDDARDDDARGEAQEADEDDDEPADEGEDEDEDEE